MRDDLKTLISILTIISFLFLLPASVIAKLTPKKLKEDKKVEVITIKKGDTLWDLAKFYYKNPFMWKKFKEFNIITNPDLIFPGEKLVIRKEDGKRLKEILEKRVIEVKNEIKEAEAKKEELEKEKKELEKGEVKEVVKIKEVKVPVQDEALLKKIAELEQEIKLLEEEKSRTKEIIEKLDEMAYLKEEEKMLQASILELEEKLSEEKKEKQKEEDFAHSLAVGAICGFILLLNAFK